MARFITQAAGFPPIAAISLKLTVSDRAPSCSGVPQFRLKWMPSTIESIVTSVGAGLGARMAQSSPGPKIVRGLSGSFATSRAINSNSPGSAVVRRCAGLFFDFRMAGDKLSEPDSMVVKARDARVGAFDGTDANRLRTGGQDVFSRQAERRF